MRILIIEDEPSLLNILAKRLKEEGHTADKAKDGKEGLNLARNTNYDFIILDIMLPSIDGLSILRTIRAENKKTPVLLLTAKNSTEDKIEGLNLGADDYLTKPFSQDELIARIRAIQRRGFEKRQNILSIGDLTLNILTREVKRGNKNIELTQKEYSLLEYLLINKENVLTRSQIAEHLWNYNFEYNSNILEVYIRYLRRKIDDDHNVKLIHTVRGMGYVIRIKNDKKNLKV